MTDLEKLKRGITENIGLYLVIKDKKYLIVNFDSSFEWNPISVEKVKTKRIDYHGFHQINEHVIFKVGNFKYKGVVYNSEWNQSFKPRLIKEK